jgi:hypothetical protein
MFFVFICHLINKLRKLEYAKSFSGGCMLFVFLRNELLVGTDQMFNYMFTKLLLRHV